MGVSNLVGSNFIELMDTSMSDKVIRCILLLLGTGYLIYLIGKIMTSFLLVILILKNEN